MPSSVRAGGRHASSLQSRVGVEPGGLGPEDVGDEDVHLAEGGQGMRAWGGAPACVGVCCECKKE